MTWFLNIFATSVGKKFLTAITGVFLIIFLLVHLFGNTFLYVGKNEFNLYVETLEHGVVHFFILLIEVVLVLSFLIHVINGVRITIENRRARGQTRYSENNPSEQVTLASRTMFISAIAIFVFIIIHLRNFFYVYKTGGITETTTAYDIVVEAFQIPFYSILYVIGILFLGFHLLHGFQSAFQTLGINNKKWTPVIKCLGTIYTIIITVGFVSFPIYFLIFYKGGN